MYAPGIIYRYAPLTYARCQSRSGTVSVLCFSSYIGVTKQACCATLQIVPEPCKIVVIIQGQDDENWER